MTDKFMVYKPCDACGKIIMADLKDPVPICRECRENPMKRYTCAYCGSIFKSLIPQQYCIQHQIEIKTGTLDPNNKS